jgi:hypothetical protein
MTHIDVPNTFQGWCALVSIRSCFQFLCLKLQLMHLLHRQISKLLAPAEELSPFKLGQIQKLISDMFVPYQLLSHTLCTLPTLTTLALK